MNLSTLNTISAIIQGKAVDGQKSLTNSSELLTSFNSIGKQVINGPTVPDQSMDYAVVLLVDAPIGAGRITVLGSVKDISALSVAEQALSLVKVGQLAPLTARCGVTRNLEQKADTVSHTAVSLEVTGLTLAGGSTNVQGLVTVGVLRDLIARTDINAVNVETFSNTTNDTMAGPYGMYKINTLCSCVERVISDPFIDDRVNYKQYTGFTVQNFSGLSGLVLLAREQLSTDNVGIPPLYCRGRTIINYRNEVRNAVAIATANVFVTYTFVYVSVDDNGTLSLSKTGTVRRFPVDSMLVVGSKYYLDGVYEQPDPFFGTTTQGQLIGIYAECQTDNNDTLTEWVTQATITYSNVDPLCYSRSVVVLAENFTPPILVRAVYSSAVSIQASAREDYKDTARSNFSRAENDCITDCVRSFWGGSDSVILGPRNVAQYDAATANTESLILNILKNEKLPATCSGLMCSSFARTMVPSGHPFWKDLIGLTGEALVRAAARTSSAAYGASPGSAEPPQTETEPHQPTPGCWDYEDDAKPDVQVVVNTFEKPLLNFVSVGSRSCSGAPQRHVRYAQPLDTQPILDAAVDFLESKVIKNSQLPTKTAVMARIALTYEMAREKDMSKDAKDVKKDPLRSLSPHGLFRRCSAATPPHFVSLSTALAGGPHKEQPHQPPVLAPPDATPDDHLRVTVSTYVRSNRGNNKTCSAPRQCSALFRAAKSAPESKAVEPQDDDNEGADDYDETKEAPEEAEQDPSSDEDERQKLEAQIVELMKENKALKSKQPKRQEESSIPKILSQTERKFQSYPNELTERSSGMTTDPNDLFSFRGSFSDSCHPAYGICFLSRAVGVCNALAVVRTLNSAVIEEFLIVMSTQKVKLDARYHEPVTMTVQHPKKKTSEVNTFRLFVDSVFAQGDITSYVECIKNTLIFNECYDSSALSQDDSDAKPIYMQAFFPSDVSEGSVSGPSLLLSLMHAVLCLKSGFPISAEVAWQDYKRVDAGSNYNYTYPAPYIRRVGDAHLKVRFATANNDVIDLSAANLGIVKPMAIASGSLTDRTEVLNSIARMNNKAHPLYVISGLADLWAWMATFKFPYEDTTRAYREKYLDYTSYQALQVAFEASDRAALTLEEAKEQYKLADNVINQARVAQAEITSARANKNVETLVEERKSGFAQSKPVKKKLQRDATLNIAASDVIGAYLEQLEGEFKGNLKLIAKVNEFSEYLVRSGEWTDRLTIVPSNTAESADAMSRSKEFFARVVSDSTNTTELFGKTQTFWVSEGISKVRDIVAFQKGAPAVCIVTTFKKPVNGVSFSVLFRALPGKGLGMKKKADKREVPKVQAAMPTKIAAKESKVVGKGTKLKEYIGNM